MLTGPDVEGLSRANLTYAEVGLTLGNMPTGYHHLRRMVVVGSGRDRFEQAARAVLGWDMHRRAGLSVRPSSVSAREGTVAVLGLGRGPFGVHAPVRVVYQVDGPRRKGFAYGTLPGHPESGEEAFMVELHDDGEVTFTISAFSRPSTVLARAGGPISRAIQAWVTHRYLRSV
jgi:uncharacterized protein (UPF0548 family)